MTNAQKAVQSIHAAIEATRQLDSKVEHPHLVLLVAKNENKLKKIQNELDKEGFQTYNFYESDRNNEMTAFAVGYIEDSQRERFKKYQLLC